MSVESSSDVSRSLDRALTLVRHCRHRRFHNQVIFSISTSAEFKKVCGLLDASIRDMRWLLAIFDCQVFGSILTIGAMVSAIFSGRIADLFGRRGVEIAKSYEKGGAACLSVLTDKKYFKLFCLMGWIAITLSEV